MALIMFDFDGVIADTFDYFVLDFVAACNQYGFTIQGKRDINILLEDNLYEAMGKRGMDQETIDRILTLFKDKAENHVDIKMFEGIDRALRQISEQNQIFVITSNVSALVAKALKANGMDYVLEVLGADVDKSKVAKIKTLMGRFPGMDAYYVGDTSGDIIEGRLAGARTVGAAWGWHGRERLAQSSPDFLVESPGQLAELLARIDDNRNKPG